MMGEVAFSCIKQPVSRYLLLARTITDRAVPDGCSYLPLYAAGLQITKVHRAAGFLYDQYKHGANKARCGRERLLSKLVSIIFQRP